MFTTYFSDVFHRHNDRLRESFDFNHGECLVLGAAVGYVDEFSLQYIFAVEFHEDLRGLGHVSIINSKLDPWIWHNRWLFPEPVSVDFTISSTWRLYSFERARTSEGGLAFSNPEGKIVWLVFSRKPPSHENCQRAERVFRIYGAGFRKKLSDLARVTKS
jgi:hypothetical protein